MADPQDTQADPNAIPPPEVAPTASAPEPLTAKSVQQDFEPYVPPQADKRAWDELRQDVERHSAGQLNAQTAAMFPETPEMGGTSRKRVKVVSERATHVQQLMGGALAEGGPLLPPAEETISYDVRPGESDDAAFQRAMEAYRAMDGKMLGQQVQSEMDAMKYTAARTASQLTLGLSSIAPGIGTQDFERRFRSEYPDAVTPLEWTAGAAGMMAASVPAIASKLPLNAVFGAAKAAFRPLRSMVMQGALNAGKGMGDAALGWNQSLAGFMSSSVGKEFSQYVRPETIERFHKAWQAVGATFKDDVVRISKEQADNPEFLAAMRAWKSELTAAGATVGTFRVMKVAANAVAGAAVGATDAAVRSLGGNTPESREQAHAQLVPMALGGLFVGGAFGLAESLYNAARAVHNPLPRVEPGAPEPSAPAAELQRMRARQLESRMKDIK